MLTAEQLRDIAEGRVALPQPTPPDNGKRIVSTTPEAEDDGKQTRLYLWRSKRDAYAERYGVPMGGNVRYKPHVKMMKAIERTLDVKIVSVRDNPEYVDRAVAYLSSKWPIPRAVYQDCVAHSAKTKSPLPRWYLMLDGVGFVIGCYGLITNDYISRQDLWPWLAALYVSEDFRGHGFGAKMLAHGKAEAKLLGFDKLYISTDHIGYYEKHGWALHRRRLRRKRRAESDL